VAAVTPLPNEIEHPDPAACTGRRESRFHHNVVVEPTSETGSTATSSKADNYDLGSPTRFAFQATDSESVALSLFRLIGTFSDRAKLHVVHSKDEN
jgi:hypothetical protein